MMSWFLHGPYLNSIDAYDRWNFLCEIRVVSELGFAALACELLQLSHSCLVNKFVELLWHCTIWNFDWIWFIGAIGEKESRICWENEEQDSYDPQGSRGEKSNDWSETWRGSAQSRGDFSKISCHWNWSEETTWLLLKLDWWGLKLDLICTLFCFGFLFICCQIYCVVIWCRIIRCSSYACIVIYNCL